MSASTKTTTGKAGTAGRARAEPAAMPAKGKGGTTTRAAAGGGAARGKATAKAATPAKGTVQAKAPVQAKGKAAPAATTGRRSGGK